MNKENEAKSDTFKKRFSNFFWWTPLPGVIADAIAIVNAIALWWLRNFQARQKALNPDPNFNPPLFPGFTLDDAVILSGLVTAFIIVNLFFVAHNTQKYSNKYSWVIASFLSALLTYFYFRLWLGEKWWIFICVIPLFLGMLVVIGILDSMTGKRSVKGSVTSTSLNETPTFYDNNDQLYPVPNNLIQNDTPSQLPQYNYGDYFQGETPHINVPSQSDMQTIIDAFYKNVQGGKELDRKNLEGEKNDVIDTMRNNWGKEKESKTEDGIMDQIRKAWGFNTGDNPKK